MDAEHCQRTLDAIRTYAISVLDPNGLIRRWNKGAALIFGTSADEAVGRHFGVFFLKEDRDIGEPARALQAAGATHGFETEGWRVGADGVPIWLRIVIEPLYDERGALTGYLHISRAAQRNSRYETAADASSAAVFQRQKLEILSHFTRRLVHDYNNLLTIITSNLDRLSKGPRDGERAQRLVASALRAAQRATMLTHQLYTFGTSEPMRAELVDVSELIRELEPSMRLACGDTIELDLSLRLESTQAWLDPMDFDAALLNLVANARDAMPRGGKINVTAGNLDIDVERAADTQGASPGRYIAISVADTGLGMTPEIIERACEPFFSTKEAGAGSGLGLSQVHGFVKQCGGNVEIQSIVAEGTTVTLLLPVARPSRDTRAAG